MFEDVKKMLVEDLSVAEDRIVPEAELVNDLGINSLELADLIMICEDKYGVTVDDDDIHRFITVGDIQAFIQYVKNFTRHRRLPGREKRMSDKEQWKPCLKF